MESDRLLMRRVVWILLLVIAISSGRPVHAGSVEIRDGSGPGRISIMARDAPPAEILMKLGQRYSFTVERNGAQGQPITGKLEGKPEDLITRLLRHEGHVVHRSAAKPIGVARIILLGDAKGAQTRPGVPPGRRIAPPRMPVDEEVPPEEEPVEEPMDEAEDPDIPPNPANRRGFRRPGGGS